MVGKNCKLVASLSCVMCTLVIQKVSIDAALTRYIHVNVGPTASKDPRTDDCTSPPWLCFSPRPPPFPSASLPAWPPAWQAAPPWPSPSPLLTWIPKRAHHHRKSRTDCRQRPGASVQVGWPCCATLGCQRLLS